MKVRDKDKSIGVLEADDSKMQSMEGRDKDKRHSWITDLLEKPVRNGFKLGIISFISFMVFLVFFAALILFIFVIARFVGIPAIMSII